jgi:hypothetical protein
VSPRSYWTYLGWLEKVSEVEHGEAHTGEDLEEPVGCRVHETAEEELQGTDVEAVAGYQEQVRTIQNSVPEEHLALMIAAGYQELLQLHLVEAD